MMPLTQRLNQLLHASLQFRKKYFKYYNHGLYWEIIEYNKESNEVIEHFMNIEEGLHDLLEYMNNQLS